MWRRSIAMTGGAALAAVVAASGASSAAEPSAAEAVAPTYTLVKLGVLAGDEFSIPAAINARGDVVGYSGGLTIPPVPFRYTEATRKIKAIPLPAGSTSGFAHDINDAGFVTGEVQASPEPPEAIRWRPNGKFLLLGALAPTFASSGGNGINNSKDVAGSSTADPNAFYGTEAFRYTDAAGMVSVTPGARPGYGFDINDAGDISGLYNFDAMRVVGTNVEIISGSLQGVTTGEAINASGQVAISQELNDANDVWRWTPGVGLEDLGIEKDDEPVLAHGINVNGDVVGKGEPIGSDNIRAGFLYRDGLGAVDLNDLLTGKGVKNWFISEAWDINDNGQIVAEALNLVTFKSQAVRLDPVP